MLAQTMSSGFLTSVLVSSSPYSQPGSSGLCNASKHVTSYHAESVVNTEISVQSRVILYPLKLTSFTLDVIYWPDWPL